MTNTTVKTFTINKKNRKYFDATVGNYKCKILIDAASENLELGATLQLQVNDLSVRSKYGVDLIFSLAANATDQKDAGICTLRHARFNQHLVDACRKLGGKWDGAEKAWVFSGMVADEVDALDDIFNSALAVYEITFETGFGAHQSAMDICGYTVARATGRDSGAPLADGVALLEGGFSSGGSTKNWETTVTAGTKIRMELPLAVVAKYPEPAAIKIQKIN